MSEIWFWLYYCNMAFNIPVTLSPIFFRIALPLSKSVFLSFNKEEIVNLVYYCVR